LEKPCHPEFISGSVAKIVLNSFIRNIGRDAETSSA
jgi:hypothetical protein